MSRRQPDPLPHQPPFRFAERKGEEVVVVPAAGAAESFPFPVPLTMLTEAMAQAILLSDPPEHSEGLRLVAIDQASLRQEVNAGDRLSVVCRKEASFGKLRRYACRALRGGSLVAEVTVTVGF